jgi:CheY-like chemotaxis protein
VQIEHVLMNLCINARDAMPEGGRLVLRTANASLDASYAEKHADVTSGSYVMVSVTDTGCGMDAETKNRVFEPFFTTKDVGKGSGLGLAVAYGVVRQSGGSIWVYSEPGKGSAFKVYLPRAVAAVPERGTAEDGGVAAAGGGETILVVEDDDNLRVLVCRVLGQAGYRILSAGTPDEALNLAGERGEVADLLLTDVVMPQMGGPDLAEKLRASRADLPVLYMSGYAESSVTRQIKPNSSTAFLEKPFALDLLLRKVREVLDSARGQTPV